MSQRKNVLLVTGGRFHDTNFARLELLKLLAEQDDAYVRVAEDYAQVLRWLSRDEVDVAVVPRIDGLQQLRASGLRGIEELDGVLEVMFLYHYVHESRRDLAESLRPVLKEMLLDGTTRRLGSEATAKLLEGR